MRLIVTFSLIIMFSCIILPQTETQKNWLRNFADEQEQIWEQQRAEAESIAVLNNLPIRQEYPDGTIIELQRFENGIPIYHITDNFGSAKTISSDKVWIDNDLGIFSLSGQGQIMGLWEVGGIPLATHQELNGRAFLMDNGGSTSQHATHTAGTLIASGVNSNAKGMSNQGQVNFYNSSNDLSEVSSAAINGLRITSHSYGLITGWRFNYYNDNMWTWFGNPAISAVEDYRFGFYTNESANWDNMLNNAPNVLVVKSAGNDRGEGPSPGTQHWVFPNHSVPSTDIRDVDGGTDGYDCINDPTGISKNTLTVGAVAKIQDGYLQPGDVRMSTFSGWGPTDDGRIKPDIVAAGINLLSSSNESNTSYATLSGTSMATPSVAGSVGLLLELQQQLNGNTPLRSSTVKGLILHTADESGTSPGPDYVFGWGLMNTFSAAQLMKINSEIDGNTLIKEETLNNGNQYQLQVESNGTEPLKVTICWIDPAGIAPAASLNPTNLMLRNDLDMRITGPGAVTYSPWVLDPSNPTAPASNGDNFRDNVEQIFIENPVAGMYTINISHKGTLINNSQQFSLIMSGNVIPVPGELTLSSPDSGAVGLPVDLTLSWTNSERAAFYNLQISTDANFTNVVFENDSIKGLSRQMGVSELQGQQQYFWRVRGKNSGGYGEWSNVREFNTMIAPPAIPVLISPLDNQVNVPVNPEFNWSSSGVVDRYWFQVATNVVFGGPVISDTNVTSTSYQADTLQEGKKYYWRVKATNVAGTSNFAQYRNFTTGLYSPGNLTAAPTQEGNVQLLWEDNSSLETKYYILRKEAGNEYSLLDSVNSENQTGYLDTNVVQGELFYRIFVANNSAVSDTSNEASVIVVSVDDKQNSIPQQFILSQNYPNPFNPSTIISFGLPAESSVKVTIYNSIGEKVDLLVNQKLSAGYHNFTWNGKNLGSGIYFYSIDANSVNGESYHLTKKMILIK